MHPTSKSEASDRSLSQLPTLIDIASLGEHLGVGERHVRRLMAERRIPYVKVGHYVRFDSEEVARWIEVPLGGVPPTEMPLVVPSP